MQNNTNRSARRAANKLARAGGKKAPMRAGFSLVDGQARHRERPDSFAIPFGHEVAALRPGDYCKVAVEPENGRDHGGERFWCWIVERRGDRVTALVSNHLILSCEHGLSLGDRITFQARHVLDVQGKATGDSEGLEADADAHAIASNVRTVCPCCHGLRHGSAAVH